ncbi:MAG: TetR/AcrR family transcriptional regulator [Micrococcales bacterium]|nr:TetR/AcrR family transcriptional regulator [Micrococcales bacterium]
MGRSRKFTDDQLLDAARDMLVVHGRAVTVAQVSAASGAPTGSVYHRFHSREEMMARLWLRSIERFHQHLLQVEHDYADPGQALQAVAVETARYSRQFPAEALAMTLYRHERLVETAPDTLHDHVAHINDQIFAMLGRLGARRFPSAGDDPRLVGLVFTCAVRLCYGLIRPYISSSTPIPEWLDDVIARAATAALTTGDQWFSVP